MNQDIGMKIMTIKAPIDKKAANRSELEDNTVGKHRPKSRGVPFTTPRSLIPILQRQTVR